MKTRYTTVISSGDGSFISLAQFYNVTSLFNGRKANKLREREVLF